MLKPYRFINDDGTPNFITIPSTYKQYAEVNFNLTGIKKEIVTAYIADKMVFNKNIINEIHSIIEEKHNKPWIDAIIDEYNNDTTFGFSEFELYALVYGDRPHKELNIHELPMRFKDEYTYEFCKKTFGQFYCVTFHHYLRKNG